MGKKEDYSKYVGASLSMVKAAGFKGSGRYAYTRETPTTSQHGLSDTRVRQSGRGDLYVVMPGKEKGKNIKHYLTK